MNQPVAVAGDDPRYLELATTLLQRMRLARSQRGIWEAADIQWWHRQERATDRTGQLFWLGEQGEPLAACITTDFGRSVQRDVLVLPADPACTRQVWATAIQHPGDAGRPADFMVRLDNAVGIAALKAAGHRMADQAAVVCCWLEAARCPLIPPLPPGYRVLSRANAPDRPHPLARRNGPGVALRLRECSLYRPELDLMAEAPGGQVAGYGSATAAVCTRPVATGEA
jgi:hypothetical protein